MLALKAFFGRCPHFFVVLVAFFLILVAFFDFVVIFLLIFVKVRLGRKKCKNQKRKRVFVFRFCRTDWTDLIGDTNEEKTSFLFLVLVSIRVSAQKLVYKNRETRISMLPI